MPPPLEERRDREAEGWTKRFEKGMLEIKRYACDGGSEMRVSNVMMRIVRLSFGQLIVTTIIVTLFLFVNKVEGLKTHFNQDFL